MKAMIFSDLITSKNVAVQLLLMSVVICGFLAWGTNETIVGTAAMATMTPMMYLFSIFAYDEMNGWERFRLSLPITKRQVVYGRYISMLIIAVISLLAAWIVSFVFLAVVQACGGLGMSTELVDLDAFIAILDCGFAGFIFIIVLASLTLPLLMRFGMNKATRLLPLLVVVTVVLASVAIGNMSGAIDLTAIRTFLNENTGLITAAACIVAAILYVASAFIAARLYRAREV